MRTKWLLVSLSAISLVFCSFMPYPGGAPSPYYYTGSPSDNHSCASCHGGASTVSGWITSNIPAGGYVPGTTYQITATNSVSGSGKYGFEVSPQNSSGTLLGTLAAGSNSKLVGSKWITQSNASNSITSWTFNWTAPVAGTGNVTFYGSFTRSTGSATKLSTLVVSEQAGSSLPAAAGPITGNAAVCQNTIGAYSVGNIIGATSYVWTVPAGAYITSGQGTTSITVNFSPAAISGNMSVYGTNTAGSGPTSNLAITVNTIPSQPSAISGPPSVCENSQADFSVVNVSGTSYIWNVPSGSVITAGQGTNTITVTIGNIEGNIEVAATNDCGVSIVREYPITILPLPGIPATAVGPNLVDLRTVTTSDYTTTGASNATSYHWDLTPTEAGSISGSGLTGTIIWNPSFLGTALVRIKALNSCGDGEWSNIMEIHVINTTGIADNTNRTVKVYPTPNNGHFYVDMKGINGMATARIMSPSGIELYTASLDGNTTNTMQVQLDPGLYFLIVESENGTFKSKLIIQ
jgi:hypothetical protein